MNGKSLLAAALLGGLLAAGLLGGGFVLGRSIERSRIADRHVTVKGLAEREVPADLALWPVVFVVTGNDLQAVQAEIETDAATIARFLGDKGFEEGEWSLSAPRITDWQAQAMGSNAPPERYQAESAVTLRTPKVDRLREAITLSGELVKNGVTLVRSWEVSTQYLFTELETIKPEMIAEATRDARRAAEQFAADSGTRVGAIRRAQQGYFSIEDRDPFSPEVKRVRVVTTVEYLLD
jgi:hypothetical protein